MLCSGAKRFDPPGRSLLLADPVSLRCDVQQGLHGPALLQPVILQPVKVLFPKGLAEAESSSACEDIMHKRLQLASVVSGLPGCAP